MTVLADQGKRAGVALERTDCQAREQQAERAAALLGTLLLGRTPVMRRLREQIARIAPMNFSVNIQGPTGSGKELVAAALHRLSNRRGNIVALNTSAIAESMFEDAMFGHVRGAFTGASGELRGYIAEANQGTLFLDEVSALGRAPQAKLLRALETKTFRPVGALRDHQSDFRLLSATNVNLEELIDRGEFREDLVERLSGATIEVPSLASRREDIPALVAHFATAATVGSDRAVEFSADALDLLQDYEWPRNVRQLRHVVERAIALTDGGVLNASAVSTALGRRGQSRLVSRGASLERCSLFTLLAASEWDTARVATQLGVNRTTVYRRMQRLGIAKPVDDARTSASMA